MKNFVMFGLLALGLNVFASVNLPAGGSAVVNGEVVTCAGSSSATTGAISCSCDSTYGSIGNVLVSGGISAVDECQKLSSGTRPGQCTAVTSSTGYYKCDCNSTYGKIGQITLTSGTSAVAECAKLSSGSRPGNCTGF